MKRITRSAIVPYSAREMYDLVEDIESYPRFLPWCVETEVHERAPGHTRATLTAGLKGIRQSFTTRNENRPGESIDMRLEEGPFRAFSATWRFRALSAGSSEIEFTLEYELAGGVVSRLLGPLFDRIADTMVDAFSRRAEYLRHDA
ncbi:MAG TPA: type II toxin-antitoxin system RatA family toxin [Burkholderiales bacterium]|nr:type II toxin-antitoxin system RatA family toxin [Burkholderiales bacterium]